VFGLAHGYQGIKGIFGTAILGAVLMIIFFAAGNLWLPIAIHALIDLRVLLLLRTGDLSTARA
jgi:membrane protease YdiL (CAAX protease family)